MAKIRGNSVIYEIVEFFPHNPWGIPLHSKEDDNLFKNE